MLPTCFPSTPHPHSPTYVQHAIHKYCIQLYDSTSILNTNIQHAIHKHCIQLRESTSILNTYIQHAIHKHCIHLYVSTSILNTYIQHAIHKHCIQLYVSTSILNTNNENAAMLRITSARQNLKEATESQKRICCLCYQDRKLLCVSADR